MKTIILTLTAVLVTVAASAQTSFTSTKFILSASDAGITTNLSTLDPVAVDSFVFQIQEDDTVTLIDIGDMIRDIANADTNALTIPGSLYSPYITISVPSYTLTTGKGYALRYRIPTSFYFKYMCSGPRDIRVSILGCNSSGEICFRQIIAEAAYQSTLVQGSHWDCYGLQNATDDCRYCYYYYPFELSKKRNSWTGDNASTDVVSCFISISLSGGY